MSQNLVKLASQGRAFSASRPWTDEELQALITLEKECEMQRTEAADYVRNGIMTPEDVEKAQKKGIEPKPLEQIHNEAVETVQEENKKVLGSTKTTKKKN